MIVMHRQIRGLGDPIMDGAMDAVRGAVTQDTTAQRAMFTPAVMQRMREPGILAPIIANRNDAIRRALRTNVSQDTEEDTGECPCLVAKLEAHAIEIGSPLTAANLMQANAMCAADAAQFQRVMVEGMGVTLGFRDLDPCRPWYMRRTTWGIAAALGVIGVAGALVMRRRK